MKKLAAILGCLAVFAIGLYYYALDREEEMGEALNFSTWTEFTPKSGLFKVFLPSPPQYGKDFVAQPGTDKKKRYDMYASEKVDGTLFLITVITYPSEIDTKSSADIMRQNIDELMHHKADNNLTKILEGVFQSHQSYEFTIENREFHVEGKSIQSGPRVFMLTYITKNDNFDQEEYKHFVDSFHIQEKAE